MLYVVYAISENATSLLSHQHILHIHILWIISKVFTSIEVILHFDMSHPVVWWWSEVCNRTKCLFRKFNSNKFSIASLYRYVDDYFFFILFIFFLFVRTNPFFVLKLFPLTSKTLRIVEMMCLMQQHQIRGALGSVGPGPIYSQICRTQSSTIQRLHEKSPVCFTQKVSLPNRACHINAEYTTISTIFLVNGVVSLPTFPLSIRRNECELFNFALIPNFIVVCNGYARQLHKKYARIQSLIIYFFV